MNILRWLSHPTFMPTFRHELGTEDGGCITTAIFHQLQEIPLFLTRSRD
ncbi:hypothetical protein G5A65_15470 [[Clostridium] scindens]|nr:hypothetical protein [[Clostridium] scindens]NSI90800.1 hypothetical protein [[Clostridium] scindens]